MMRYFLYLKFNLASFTLLVSSSLRLKFKLTFTLLVRSSLRLKFKITFTLLVRYSLRLKFNQINLYTYSKFFSMLEVQINLYSTNNFFSTLELHFNLANSSLRLWRSIFVILRRPTQPLQDMMMICLNFSELFLYLININVNIGKRDLLLSACVLLQLLRILITIASYCFNEIGSILFFMLDVV